MSTAATFDATHVGLAIKNGIRTEFVAAALQERSFGRPTAARLILDV